MTSTLVDGPALHGLCEAFRQECEAMAVQGMLRQCG